MVTAPSAFRHPAANVHINRREHHPAFSPVTTTSSTSPGATPGPELNYGGSAVTAGESAAGTIDRRGAGGRRRLRRRLE